MNPVHELQALLVEKLPTATITLDEPDHPNGTRFLDVQMFKHAVTVEWRPSMGFGISTPGGEYGVGPDELHRGVVDEAFERVVALASIDAADHGKRTSKR